MTIPLLGSRRRSLSNAIGALVMLALCGATAKPGWAESLILWGVNGHPLSAYRGVTVEQQLDLVASLGMRAYRVDVVKLDQADALAALIAKAKARQIEIVPVLIPALDLDKEDAATLVGKARDFASAYVRRFRNDVPIWELGNELENYAIIKPCEKREDGTIYPCDWGPAGGTIPLDYEPTRVAKVIAVLRGLSEGTHAAKPKAQRAMGSAGWGHVGIFTRLRDQHVEWDISVWHTYQTEFEWALKVLKTFGKPIWITEFNNPFGSAKKGETGQADGLRDLMKEVTAFAPRYDIRAAFIYELLDESYWAPDFEASMGRVRLDATPGGGWRLGAPKAAFDAAKDAIAKSSR